MPTPHAYFYAWWGPSLRSFTSETPLTKSMTRRSAKMFPNCKNLTSALANMGAEGHMHKKQAHLPTPEHTVDTHRAGNASCRLHGLEMRNMIHFLSMLDSHTSTQGWVQIHSSEAKSRTWHTYSPGQEKPMCGELASHTYCMHFKATTTGYILRYWPPWSCQRFLYVV